jgi:hypothetical protein
MESWWSVAKANLIRRPVGVVTGHVSSRGRLKNQLTRCEVADDPVIVSKPRPAKAGNSLEDKTAVTRRLVVTGGASNSRQAWITHS